MELWRCGLNPHHFKLLTGKNGKNPSFASPSNSAWISSPSSSLSITTTTITLILVVLLVVLLNQTGSSVNAAPSVNPFVTPAKAAGGTHQPERKIRLCGIRLVNVLKKLCHNRFSFSSSRKRVKAESIFRRRRSRSRRGIVDQCCHHSCAYSTLKSYCDTSPSPSTPASTTNAPIINTAAAHRNDKDDDNGIVINGARTVFASSTAEDNKQKLAAHIRRLMMLQQLRRRSFKHPKNNHNIPVQRKKNSTTLGTSRHNNPDNLRTIFSAATYLTQHLFPESMSIILENDRISSKKQK